MTRKEKTIVVNLHTRDLTSFLYVLKNMYSIKHENEKCENCNSYSIKSKFTFGNQICIELFVPPFKRESLNTYSVASLTLSKIPLSLCLDSRSFTLRGVINLHSSIFLKDGAINRSICFLLLERTNIWERYDNLKCNSKIVTQTTIIENCQFIYYIQFNMIYFKIL